MGSTSTVYDVKVRYGLDDKAGAGIKSIADHTSKAADSAFSLKAALAAVGGVALLHKGKELLIDFNSEMDALKNSMTVVMQMNMHMPFEKASAAADKLFETFQALAKKSPLMTKDFMEMASAIAPAVSMAGGGVGKLETMTRGALAAGLAFNVRPEQMAMDIQEMLAGNVRLTSRTARQLLASQGLDHNDFNKKDSKERAQVTEKIFGDPAIIAGVERASHSLAGEISTVKDNMQIAFGEVGRPLMVGITAEFKKINTWIEQHPKKIKEWVTSFSSGLETAFGYLKSVAGFFMDNRELLFSLAKVFVAFKGAQMASGIFANFTKGIGGFVESLKKGTNAISSGDGFKGVTSAFGGFSGIVSGITSRVIPALGLFAGAIELATYALDSHRDEDRKAREAAMDINEAIGDYPDLKARREKLINNSAGDPMRTKTELENLEKTMFSPEHLGLALRKISDASEKHGGHSIKDMSTSDIMDKNFLLSLPNTFDYKASKEQNEEIYKKSIQVLELVQKTGVLDNGMQLDRILKYAFPEQYGMPTPTETPAPGETWGGGSKPEVNVTIQKVEVASEDPDRLVFGLVNMSLNAVKHSTQSQHSIAGGF